MSEDKKENKMYKIEGIDEEIKDLSGKSIEKRMIDINTVLNLLKSNETLNTAIEAVEKVKVEKTTFKDELENLVFADSKEKLKSSLILERLDLARRVKKAVKDISLTVDEVKLFKDNIEVEKHEKRMGMLKAGLILEKFPA